MDGELRTATIAFLAELCESVGPWVFAGYGGRVARLRHEVEQAAGDDLVAGIVAAEARVQEVMQAWADQAPVPAIFSVLLDVVLRPPGALDPEAWRREATELLAMCAARDGAGFAAAMQTRPGDPELASVAEDVEELLAERAG